MVEETHQRWFVFGAADSRRFEAIRSKHGVQKSYVFQVRVFETHRESDFFES